MDVCMKRDSDTASTKAITIFWGLLMKRIGLLVAGFIIGIFLIGCENSTSPETQYYYYESFTMTIADFKTVNPPVSYSFNATKNYKEALKAMKVENMGSGTDATRSDIYKLLTDAQYSSSEANETIAAINSGGNAVIAFYFISDSSLYAILYLEKL
jgi:hypothetical protein